MLRVLELFGEPISHGGQEAFAINVVNALDSNYHIDFLTPYYEDNVAYKNIVEAKGGEIYALNLPFNPGGVKFAVEKPIKQFLNNHRYDIVHINSGSTFFLAVVCKVAKKTGVRKVIAHSHSSGEKENLKHVLIKKFAGYYFYRYADQICSTSLVAAKWKFPERLISDNLVIIRNGIDTEKFKFNSELRFKMRKKLGIADSTYVIGHVGRFTEEKNQLFLIDVFKQYSEINNDSLLIFVGEGELLYNAKQLVEKYELKDKVFFAGTTDHVENYLQAFDIFAFPSKYEGLGIAAIEAESTGLPVIASTNIPHEIKLTDSVKFISLNKGITTWISAINKFKSYKRTDGSFLVEQAGYSLQNLKKQIQKIYKI